MLRHNGRLSKVKSCWSETGICSFCAINCSKMCGADHINVLNEVHYLYDAEFEKVRVRSCKTIRDITYPKLYINTWIIEPDQ